MIGSLCHFEIPAKDIEKSGEFYKQVFKWKLNTSDFPGYGLLELPREPHAGVEKREPFSNGVMIYIQVADISQTLNVVREAGGEIVKGKTEIPNIGWFGLFSDPDGNVIGVYQSNKS
ncbi:MAG: VOC family protein [candidate division Zixibacteria bacterium]|nr:VOC family protein [candidate division Zixibacteria bacterium]